MRIGECIITTNTQADKLNVLTTEGIPHDRDTDEDVNCKPPEPQKSRIVKQLFNTDHPILEEHDFAHTAAAPLSRCY